MTRTASYDALSENSGIGPDACHSGPACQSRNHRRYRPHGARTGQRDRAVQAAGAPVVQKALDVCRTLRDNRVAQEDSAPRRQQALNGIRCR
jgi:hypothetical protein